MGFLNRLRGGAEYGPVAGANDAGVSGTSPDTPGALPAPEQRGLAASEAVLPAAAARGAHALFSIIHRTPNQRTTAAEQAFMDLKRGSND